MFNCLSIALSPLLRVQGTGVEGPAALLSTNERCRVFQVSAWNIPEGPELATAYVDNTHLCMGRQSNIFLDKGPNQRDADTAHSPGIGERGPLHKHELASISANESGYKDERFTTC